MLDLIIFSLALSAFINLEVYYFLVNFWSA
jgi:hypothetical protein